MFLTVCRVGRNLRRSSQPTETDSLPQEARRARFCSTPTAGKGSVHDSTSAGCRLDSREHLSGSRPSGSERTTNGSDPRGSGAAVRHSSQHDPPHLGRSRFESGVTRRVARRRDRHGRRWPPPPRAATRPRAAAALSPPQRDRSAGPSGRASLAPTAPDLPSRPQPCPGTRLPCTVPPAPAGCFRSGGAPGLFLPPRRCCLRRCSAAALAPRRP
ncbi:MAG: hypothetical protein JWR86_1767 [Enterovirga sp.]|nr:hypothetical protein [Enterovirga sp.]